MLSVSSPHASSWITAIPSTSLKLHLDSAEYQTAIRWWLGLNTSEASPCPFCPELVLDPLGHHAASCRHAMLRDASTSAGSAAYAAECRKHEANDTKCQELGWTCIPLAVETFGHWGKEAQAVFSRLASFIAIHRASPKSSVLNESIVVSTCPWLRDVFAESCRRACIGVQVEAGSGLGRNEHHTRPADVLATNWMLGKPAAFDFAVTSPLNSSTLHEASVTAGSAAHATEARKHQANDVKCAELGWVSIPVVVETYGCWVESFAQRPPIQKALSAKIDDFQFNQLFDSSSLADRARLLSISSPHASSWLSVVPSEGLGLHLNPDQFQVAIKWWLGLDTFGGSLCSLCPDTVLDPLGHHASTSVDIPDPNWTQAQLSPSMGGFGLRSLSGHSPAAFISSLAASGFGNLDNVHLQQAVTRFNSQVSPQDAITIEAILASPPPQSSLSKKIKVGYGLSLENINSRPADILVQSWDRGHLAAFDVTVTSPLTPAILNISSIYEGAAGRVAEARKHTTNDAKCQDLGWLCIPLAVEMYGNWGKEAHEVLIVSHRYLPLPKATDFFAPLQYGVACTAGAEKFIHGVRSCIKEHWIDDNFTVCKVDMSNAFNCVSRQALLEECAVHFPELLPWVGWCYGSQPTLWHPLGQLSSEVGVQQGDPLGPLLFSLVLHKVVSYIAQDRECLPLLFNGWYLDDGVLLGHSQAVNRALTLIQEMGPSLGLFVNVSKCELFGCGDLSSFPPEMKVSRVPNLVIVGAPIGDLIFCAKFVAQKRADAAVLLSQLAECAAFCKLVHLARSAPPSHIAEGLALFDKDVRQCFAECTAVDAADVEWMQAQLSLSRGGQVEVGSGQGHDRLNSRPADVLVQNWHLGKPAAFDLTITFPLNPTILTEAGVKCGSSAQVAEVRKHAANDGKCKELGWVCIPLAVESYGCWGTEAQESFKRLAARLAIQMGCSRS
eukprot:Em0001g3120a